MKNIVIIGGGTGTFTLLKGLRKFPVNNSVIVSSADDGGSTGILRKELGVFPPGDLRQCLVGLSYTEESFKELFNYRFSEGELKGHAVGNLILAALEKITGSVDKAVSLTGKILNVRGEVLPVTLKPTLLTAVYENGKTVVGEHKIDQPKQVKSIKYTIKSLKLSPLVQANPKALKAVKQAHVIVLGPGDLYTSILPNLLVKGVKEAIDSSKAIKVLVTGLMTRPGQTNGFTTKDFVEEVNKYLGKKKLDLAVVNTKKPQVKALSVYKKTGSEFVEPDKEIPNTKIIGADLLSDAVFVANKADKLQRSFLRHDSDKLAKIIYDL